MKRVFKILTISLLMVFLTTALFAEGQGEAEEKTANLVYVNWAEGVAYTHLAKNILEKEMGYDVTITAADVAPAYTSVAQGDQDAFMETWLPVLHQDYLQEYKEDIIDLGHVFEGTQSGLVVPQYMYDAGIQTVSDLKKDEAMNRLDKKITGIDAGAGVMKTCEGKVMPSYSLTDAGYKLVASSGPAMAAALKDAVDNNEWIVVTGWKPHWKFAKWDLKFLKQDQEVVWKKGNIHIMGRKDLREDKPELAQFLSNMMFTTEEIGSLMLAVYESDADPLEVSAEWMENNKDVWQDWIP